jgi:hypothetical protein
MSIEATVHHHAALYIHLVSYFNNPRLERSNVSFMAVTV